MRPAAGTGRITSVASSDRPDLRPRLGSSAHSWPNLLLHAARPRVDDRELTKAFAAFRTFYLVDGELAAHSHAVPLRWSGTIDDLPRTWNGAIERAFVEHAAGEDPNTLCALGVEVVPSFQRRGLAAHALAAMKALAAGRGFDAVIVPLRPVGKKAYPDTSIEDYAARRREDGAPEDYWIRTHWRLGASILACTEAALLVEGTVAEWQRWCQRLFLVSGAYAVEGALAPVVVDRERDRCVYEEPAVWMLHRVRS